MSEDGTRKVKGYFIQTRLLGIRDLKSLEQAMMQLRDVVDVAVVVTLRDTKKVDDALGTRDALSQLTSVGKITLVEDTPDDYINRARVRAEIRKALYQALADYPARDSGGGDVQFDS